MRKTLGRLAVAAVLAAGLAGCSGGPLAQDDGVKRISMWHCFNPEETIVFRQIIAEFETEYEARTGEKLSINLEYTSFGDMFGRLRTAAMAHITPDIAFMDSIKVMDMAFGRAVIPLEELDGFKERYASISDAREQFVNASFDSGVVNRAGEESVYGLPVQTTTVSLFWNREMFREKAAELRAAGLDPNRPPRDWQELEEYGAVLTDPARGIYAYGHYGSLWFNFALFNMYDVDFIAYDKDGRPVERMATPNGEAALARIQQIVNSGVEGGAWRRGALGPDAGFLNRRYAMCMTGPWNVENFTNAGLDFDIAYIPSPTAEEIRTLGISPRMEPEPGQESGAPWSSSNVGGQTGVILRSSEQPDLAYEVLEYFTSERVQRRWASELGQIPTRLSAWEDLDTSKYPYMTKFMDQLALAKRIPQIPLYGVLENDIFNPQVDLLLQNRQTPAEMAQRMVNSMETQIIRKMNQALDGLER